MDATLNILQILLITAWAFWGIIDSLSFNIGMNNCILACLFTGFIVGNVEYGLIVGGTLQMTQLGIGTYGGASVLNITSSGMITTALGATSGEDPIAFSASIGIALAALFVQLDILARFSNTAFQHIADKYVESANMGGINLMNHLGILPWGLSRGLPVFLLLLFGQDLVASIIAIVPQFVMDGFKIAGGLLPVVGFSILLRYLPVLKKPAFLVLGFALAAYLPAMAPLKGASLVDGALTTVGAGSIGFTTLGVALIGLACAFVTYQSAVEKAENNKSTGGDDYDE